MRLGRAPLVAAACLAIAPTTAGAEESTEARIQALEAQLSQLQPLLGRLQSELTALKASVAQQTTVAAPPTAPVLAATSKPAAAPPKVSIAGGRPSITSADENFSATFHGVMQLDTAAYFQDDNLPPSVTARDLSSGANFRRARIGMDGRVFGNFDYNILFDFGGSGAEDTGRVQEMWVQYSALKPWRFRIGAFAPPLGLEDAASTNGALFPERPAAADIARGLAGGDTRLGAGVVGNGERWFASAILTGPLVSGFNSGATAFNAPAFDEQYGYALRLAGVPYQDKNWLAHLGVNYATVLQPQDLGASATVRYPLQLRERPELRVDGTRLVDTGQIDATSGRQIGLEAAVRRKNLFLQAEYFDIQLDRRFPAAGVGDPSFSGWYVEGSWVLTGESRKYNNTPGNGTAAFDAPSVERPFNLKTGGWGAWEVAARYSTVDLNHTPFASVPAARVRGGEQSIWLVGVNWFPNPAVKFMLDYYAIDIDRLNAAGQSMSQDIQAINLRSQVAF